MATFRRPTRIHRRPPELVLVGTVTIELKGLNELLTHFAVVEASTKSLDLETVTKCAVIAKGTVIRSVSPHKLSRFNNGRGVTLSARFVLKPGVTPAAILYPTPPGPWYLLEGGGKEHLIGRRVAGAGKRGKRGQAGFLGNPGLGFAAYGPVTHPAEQPTHAWSKATAPAIANSAGVFRQIQRQKYLKLFAG